MKFKTRNRTMSLEIRAATLALAALLLCQAAAGQVPGVGKLVRYEKLPKVERGGETRDLFAGDWLYAGDVIRTGKGKAELRLWGGMRLLLGKRTVVAVREHDPETGHTALTIETGAVRVLGTRLPENARVEVKTRGFLLMAERPDLFFRLQQTQAEAAVLLGDATMQPGEAPEVPLPAGHMVLFVLREQKERVQPVPPWYEKMMAGLVAMRSR